MNEHPDSSRRTARCSVAGSGTYCSVRYCCSAVGSGAAVLAPRGSSTCRRLFFSLAKATPCAPGREEQRLDAERVPRAEEHPLLEVPDEEGEHAAQPGHRVRAPHRVGRDDGLGVALGGEPDPVLAGQLLPQLEVVVDLAVEDDAVAAGHLAGRARPGRVAGEHQGLVGALDVDDGQPVEAERHVVVVPDPRLVRPAVPHAGQRGLDVRREARRRALRRDPTHQPAHVAQYGEGDRQPGRHPSGVVRGLTTRGRVRPSDSA